MINNIYFFNVLKNLTIEKVKNVEDFDYYITNKYNYLNGKIRYFTHKNKIMSFNNLIDFLFFNKLYDYNNDKFTNYEIDTEISKKVINVGNLYLPDVPNKPIIMSSYYSLKNSSSLFTMLVFYKSYELYDEHTVSDMFKPLYMNGIRFIHRSCFEIMDIKIDEKNNSLYYENYKIGYLPFELEFLIPNHCTNFMFDRSANELNIRIYKDCIKFIPTHISTDINNNSILLENAINIDMEDI